MLSEAYLASADPESAAVSLLGAVIRRSDVAIRIVEVEAYGGPPDGPWPDPASHSFRGPTGRNAVMFGPAGRLYVYLSYGMHSCVNVTFGHDGRAGAVLVRAGRVVDGTETVRERRPGVTEDGFARGPGNLGRSLGVTAEDYGTPVFDPSARVTLTSAADMRGEVVSGPRVGVSTAADRPWRFWLGESWCVSSYRRSPRAPAVRRGAPTS